MIKKLKGFTLIELVIVMAILVILMSAIMNMFKPIRETYVDATLYESQRTAQNGVVQYITESIRYSTDLGMYTKDKVSDANGAVVAFTDAYLAANNVTTSDPDYATKRANTLSKVKSMAEIIVIDNTADEYSFNREKHTGRILRRKFVKNTSYSPSTDPEYKKYNELSTSVEKEGTAEWRLALGAAYYGESDYAITFGIKQDATTKAGDASAGIKVTVASNASYGIRENVVISNSGLVMCKNLTAPINGMFDTTKFNSATASGDNTKIYIVYLNDKIEITK